MGILAGLVAALAWTLASSLWRGLSTSLSAIQLNGLKNLIACAALLPVLVTLPWNGEVKSLMLLLISGGLGISLGDSFYLAALRRLGTRRTLTLESLAPVAAAAGGWFAMGEQLSVQGWAGALLVTISVVLVALQQPPDATRLLDRSRRVQTQGLLLGLLAVVCGVAGAAVSRTVLINSELTPLQSAACRLLGGLLLLLPWLRLAARFPRPRPRSVRWPRVLAATVLGTVLGILLQQVVLQRLPLGIGITVLSTAPVMALVVARAEGDQLKPSVLLASTLAVTGVGLAVLS
ncbi:EamA-like transporter family protein [Synechococcus sp. MIT S9509]|uniref:DMT family transporter n=1 Tax=unclassified Synechococcus TaxID=2626047 RepID=UPI0007BC3916|nr:MULTISPECIES: DMT family transporter [unclassified Synechococcus]KZR83983.1 EamA-like transporter family protein [Synechococcus sp. MIT S9504]KZR89050.1 EamA-like transporter family protein [Synechococcus sp. MIT S9509]